MVLGSVCERQKHHHQKMFQHPTQRQVLPQDPPRAPLLAQLRAVRPVPHHQAQTQELLRIQRPQVRLVEPVGGLVDHHLLPRVRRRLGHQVEDRARLQMVHPAEHQVQPQAGRRRRASLVVTRALLKTILSPSRKA